MLLNIDRPIEQNSNTVHNRSGIWLVKRKISEHFTKVTEYYTKIDEDIPIVEWKRDRMHMDGRMDGWKEKNIFPDVLQYNPDIMRF